MKLVNSLLGIDPVVISDEGETTRVARLPVLCNVNSLQAAELAEQLLQVALLRVLRQVCDPQTCLLLLLKILAAFAVTFATSVLAAHARWHVSIPLCRRGSSIGLDLLFVQLGANAGWVSIALRLLVTVDVGPDLPLLEQRFANANALFEELLLNVVLGCEGHGLPGEFHVDIFVHLLHVHCLLNWIISNDLAKLCHIFPLRHGLIRPLRSDCLLPALCTLVGLSIALFVFYDQLDTILVRLSLKSRTSVRFRVGISSRI